MLNFSFHAIGQVSIVREIGLVQMGRKRRRLLECRCICGETMTVRADTVWRTKSCRSCKYKAESVRSRQSGGVVERLSSWKKSNPDPSIKHGEANKTPEYRAWRNMVDRCENQNCKRWEDYGGRGIVVCAEWRSDYVAFLSCVGRKPTPKHSLDRINNDGNYEPGNVRWATASQQRRNQRHRWVQK